MIRASDPRHWAELCAAFDTLVELDADARAERLAAIGASDPAAQRALEQLLEADASAGDRLGRIEGIFGGADPSPNRDVLKLVGQTVAHFRIVGPLATGGMGVVYRAIDTQLARPVALKFPLPGQRIDRQVRERFLREARAAGALDHPNICSIYETGEREDGQLFLAMPLYEGETLKARIARAGPLPIADALAIAAHIARGLHAAHRAGIVHRDLKPANVMILPDGAVKILDFGIARVGDVTSTASHGALGTVAYMAPEQIRGEQLDGRADFWALGVLLYEMLTGRRPFAGEHEIAIAHTIVHSDPIRPSTLRPEIWPELDALMLELLSKQAGSRPVSAEALAAELTALQLPSPASTVRRWRPSFTAVQRPLLSVWMLALLMTAVGAAAWLLRAGTTRESAEPRSVAVLPFENLGAREDADYLAIALADAIATQLSGLKAVAVLAGEPGASTVVRGSVRRAGDEVQVQIDLFDAAQKRRTWAREYRSTANTLLTLPQRATEGVVTALSLDLTSAERSVLTRAPTTSPEAYDLYLRGRAAQIRAASDSQRQMERLQQAQSYYALAREHDPHFAAPRASLATSHLALARYDRTSARRDQARLEAEAALRLQPGLPEAHEALASYWLLRDDQLKAIGELEQALATRPSEPHLYSLLGTILRRLGRLEEAAAAFERACRLDQRNSGVHRDAALTYSRLRRYENAIAHWDRVIAMDSTGDPFPRIVRGFAYLRYGEVDSLDAAISRIPLGRDAGGLTTYAHYIVHRVAHRHAEALASLDSARVAITIDGPNGVLYRPVALLRGQTLERMGDVTKARSAYEVSRALLEDSVTAHPQDARIRIALGLTYAGLRRHTDAMREAHTATELAAVSERGIFPEATAAMGGAVEIYVQLGEADAALELIELLLAMPAGREVSVPLLRLDPTFDPLRSDPRFEALLRRFSGN